jgi:hypothetical protein
MNAEVTNRLVEKGHLPFYSACAALSYTRCQLDGVLKKHPEVGVVVYKRLRYIDWAALRAALPTNLLTLLEVPEGAADALKLAASRLPAVPAAKAASRPPKAKPSKSKTTGR